jgi:hypothetical protein
LESTTISKTRISTLIENLKTCPLKVKLQKYYLRFVHCTESHLLLFYGRHISVLTTHWYQCSNLIQVGISSPVQYHQKNALPLHLIGPASWRECSPDQRQHYGSAETEAASQSHIERADVQNTCTFKLWICSLSQV